MRIEAKHVTGGCKADEWGSEPDLRAEIKMKIAEEIARKLRTNDAIDWSWQLDEKGDFVVTGSIDLQK
jgi:hypothetical protein